MNEVSGNSDQSHQLASDPARGRINAQFRSGNNHESNKNGVMLRNDDVDIFLSQLKTYSESCAASAAAAKKKRTANHRGYGLLA